MKTQIKIIIFTFCLFFLHTQSYAESNPRIQQRAEFKKALLAANQKNWESVRESQALLNNYPLSYFLDYLRIMSNFANTSPQTLLSFLQRYGDSAEGEKLRRKWLYVLAKEKAWRLYSRVYQAQKSIILQCHYATARLITGQARQAALHDIKKIWLTGDSRPSACDPAFNYLYNSPVMTNKLLLERIRLAMKKNHLGVAQAVAKHLPPQYQAWADHWFTMHKNPLTSLNNFTLRDTYTAREILLHGLHRLAKTNFEAAVQHWEYYQQRFNFDAKQWQDFYLNLALHSVKAGRSDRMRWLLAVPAYGLEHEKLHRTRFKEALKQQNWRALKAFYADLPKKDKESYRWKYWYARALEQLGEAGYAKVIFTELAALRDYYGYLAADRVALPYQLQNHPTQYTRQEGQAIRNHPYIERAYEFYRLDRLIDARRAWAYGMKRFSKLQQAISARLARQWGWYDRGIFTAARAGAYDDVDVRFPLAYRQAITRGARHQKIDLAWTYAIVRQESAFMEKVRSHAGALGLMQLMPATARLVARKQGFSLANNKAILDVETNVRLGTGYLQQMLALFDGNYMLATAAYNAGPGRAKRWAKNYPCLPTDIWVEMIPFKETQGYVKNVMFYTSLFEKRLGLTVQPLRISLDKTTQQCS